jgi:1-acyl-sn-glycerol-3-phosphate acyltransferase
LWYRGSGVRIPSLAPIFGLCLMETADESMVDEPTPERLLAIARAVATEQHPHLAANDITLDSSIDRDMALDSLGRLELLGRIETEFDVRLSEALMSSTETPRDLWRSLVVATPLAKGQKVGVIRKAPAATTADTLPPTQGNMPTEATTLIEVLDWHVAAHPDKIHVRFLRGDDDIQELTYAGLRRAADDVATGLRELGLAHGETVAIMLPTCLEFFYAYFGILIAGGVPVPIYPPARLNQIEDHLKRQAGVLTNAVAKVLITVPEAKTLARYLRAQTRSLDHVVTSDDLRRGGSEQLWPVLSGEDLAFIQYTSGSTGNPKGVMLTHNNLLANLRAMGQPFQMGENHDVFVSWLPLYHDMGLIGAWLGSLYFSMELVLMSPLRFLIRPERWLHAISKYKGTLSASPNFGYELCRMRIKDEALEGLDLSSWRVAANGAEAVLQTTITGFAERFREYGFNPQTMRPVYGLAENSVGLAFPQVDREPIAERIDRDIFSRTGEAVPVPVDTTDPLEFMVCGQPLPGHEIRIVDDAGRELEERREGDIEFRGPSSTQGYYRNPEATKTLFNGDWLRTGDKGYLVKGEVVVSGREKDTIVRAGRNIYAAQLEAAVYEVIGIRKGCVAIFGSPNKDSGTEDLVVLAETRIEDSAERNELEKAVNRAVIDSIGEPPDQVVLAPPHTVLKTSSGKIRRSATRQVYERGGHNGKRPPVWMQLARLVGSSIGPHLMTLVRTLRGYGYAGYWWLMAALFGIPTWGIISLVPSRRFGHAFARILCRGFLAMIGARVRVEGLEHMGSSDGPTVIVANHTSYMDAVMLYAALPGTFQFVAKNSLAKSSWSGPFLRHLGALFVERFDAAKGVADSDRMLESIREGQKTVVFPEGTFGRMPGLLPFRMGAFLNAAGAGARVLPVALRGGRSMLRSGSWFPRHSELALEICDPCVTDQSGWDGAIALRDQARKKMLLHTAEPDLKFETGEIEKLKPQT